MYRKLTSLRWHTYLPADAGETFTSTLDLFFAGPFLFAKPELAKHKNSRKTLLSSIFREFLYTCRMRNVRHVVGISFYVFMYP